MNSYEEIVFGGGCFWCTEAVFQIVPGVVHVTPGYTGGVAQNPTWEEVCKGKSSHIEVVKVEYDATKTNLKTLLDIFFKTHDPTSVDKQGHDVGPQYRSIIYYTNEKQKKYIEEFIAKLHTSGSYSLPVVTQVQPLDTFYEAEDYHKNYFARNKNAPYCRIVIQPKVEKVSKLI